MVPSCRQSSGTACSEKHRRQLELDQWDDLSVPNCWGARADGLLRAALLWWTKSRTVVKAGCMVKGLSNGFQPDDCWALPSCRPGVQCRNCQVTLR